jgi:heat shock 70kDa protein 1/2/6/8
MVEEAERYKVEDEVNKQRVEAKNALENYSYSMRNTMNDSKVAGNMDAGDKSTLDAKISETIAWLDANQSAEKEEYEEKQKELEAVANPILSKMSGGGAGAPGGMPDMGGAGGSAPEPVPDATEAGPRIEEID